MLQCRDCKVMKPESDFHPSRLKRPQTPYCRLCMSRRSKEWVTRNPDYFRRYQVGKYGLTLEEWDTLFAAQDHRCAICRGSCGDKPCVDHCHDSGRVRGILCNNCNRALGLFADDRNRLMNAVAYLESAC